MHELRNLYAVLEHCDGYLTHKGHENTMTCNLSVVGRAGAIVREPLTSHVGSPFMGAGILRRIPKPRYERSAKRVLCDLEEKSKYEPSCT